MGLYSSEDTLAVAWTRLCHLVRVCMLLWCAAAAQLLLATDMKMHAVHLLPSP